MDNKNIEHIQVNISDYYGNNLNDSINKNKNIDKNRGPKGYVEIYEVLDDGNKKLIGKSNLVTNLGREWVAQRLFNTNNTNVSSTYSDHINWIGLGDGGTVDGDPFNPISPTSLDTGLDSEIMIHATDSTCADYRLIPTVGYYKMPIDSIEFEQDPNNYDSYLIVKCTITIGADYANGYNLSEIGLYTSPSNSGGETGPFSLYGKVTFPSITKTSSRILTFIWYIYV